MKHFYILSILTFVSCGQEPEEPLVTSQVNCIVPAYTIVPEGGFKNEDSVTVAEIVQLR